MSENKTKEENGNNRIVANDGLSNPTTDAEPSSHVSVTTITDAIPTSNVRVTIDDSAHNVPGREDEDSGVDTSGNSNSMAATTNGAVTCVGASIPGDKITSSTTVDASVDTVTTSVPTTTTSTAVTPDATAPVVFDAVAAGVSTVASAVDTTVADAVVAPTMFTFNTTTTSCH